VFEAVVEETLLVNLTYTITVARSLAIKRITTLFLIRIIVFINRLTL